MSEAQKVAQQLTFTIEFEKMNTKTPLTDHTRRVKWLNESMAQSNLLLMLKLTISFE